MLECRDLIEHQIYWKLRMGSAQFWFDNWTDLGALYFQVPVEFGIDDDIHNVNDLVENGMWNVDKMFESLSEDLAHHIVQNIRPPTESSQLDTSFWMLEIRGHFIVKSAWDYLRRRANPRLAYKMIWVKGLPFKISFFMWKVWKAKLPLDDFLRKLGYSMPSKCWCYADPKEESLLHLFFTSNAARSVRSYFLRRAGISLDGLSLHQAITKCWTAPVVPRLKPVLQALPAYIVWELWKRRKSLKYGEVVSVSRVIYQVSSTLQALVQLKRPGLHVPHKWLDVQTMMEQGWIKVNTDGACRGNPRRSSIGFYIRDEVGDLIYAKGREISEGTNNVSEAVAIAETDSMLLKNIIEESWKPPWYITEHVEEILRLKEQSIIKVTHIFREGNTLADHLANYALDEGNTECHGFWDLDSKGRRIINEDKMQCPYIRVKAQHVAACESCWFANSCFCFTVQEDNHEPRQWSFWINAPAHAQDAANGFRLQEHSKNRGNHYRRNGSYHKHSNKAGMGQNACPESTISTATEEDIVRRA
uniref:Uncharacterized protein LOC104226764 n=1 Tax=Nicotiana sylvestris TaxID=4096 RepID=A0A1U7WSB2_NICSY|nr:PREDICTED: uncharacterized protein LOC104226764 [Nicotiana sylvestris]